MTVDIPRITFKSPAQNWAVEKQGVIKDGAPLAVSWSPDRIKDPFTVDTGDGPSYTVVNAHAHFLGVDQFAEQPVAQASDLGPLTPQDAVFQVPKGATGVELWFENPHASSGQVYDEKWDSNYGQDWSFPTGK